MPGHRFFSPFNNDDHEILIQDEEELAHLSRVLRLKPGDPLEIVNGKGALASGRLLSVGKSSAGVLVDKIISLPRSSFPMITIACAIPKKAKFELIIEKCTELGVDRIIPLVTKRTEGVAGGASLEKKSVRFNRVVINAAKQSRRLWFPEMSLPMHFEQALKELHRPDTGLFIPWLEGERLSLREAIQRASAAKELVFFIGPEGDFTPEEVDLAVKAGALPVTLGPHVLKVETAAMAVVAFASQMIAARGDRLE